MPVISTGWPASTGVSLTAFQFSPSINTLPPAESMRESAFTVLPIIVSAPALDGLELRADAFADDENEKRRRHDRRRNDPAQRQTESPARR